MIGIADALLAFGVGLVLAVVGWVFVMVAGAWREGVAHE